jgi:hypothetical protein
MRRFTPPLPNVPHGLLEYQTELSNTVSYPRRVCRREGTAQYGNPLGRVKGCERVAPT